MQTLIGDSFSLGSLNSEVVEMAVVRYQDQKIAIR